MTAPEALLEAIAAHGGIVELDAGNRIRYELTGAAAPYLAELIASREAVRHCLQQREAVPAMPPGVRLLAWRLRAAPVMVQTVSVVGDPAAFVRATIQQLAAAISDPAWNWIVPHLCDRLAQAGVQVVPVLPRQARAAGRERHERAELTDNQDYQDHQDQQSSRENHELTGIASGINQRDAP